MKTGAYPRLFLIPCLMGWAVTLTAASAWAAEPPPAPDTRAALAAISSDQLLQHIRVLSSDTFEGRLPATHGEELTIAYLVREFRRLGLEPADKAGKHGPVVPMTVLLKEGGREETGGRAHTTLKSPEDNRSWSSERRPHFQIK